MLFFNKYCANAQALSTVVGAEHAALWLVPAFLDYGLDQSWQIVANGLLLYGPWAKSVYLTFYIFKGFWKWEYTVETSCSPQSLKYSQNVLQKKVCWPLVISLYLPNCKTRFFLVYVFYLWINWGLRRWTISFLRWFNWYFSGLEFRLEYVWFIWGQYLCIHSRLGGRD